MNMISLLKKALKKKMIRPIDFYFAKFIGRKSNVMILIAVCISYENNNGHIFLPIKYFEKYFFVSIFGKKFLKQILFILGKKIKWLEEIKENLSVNNGSIITPLVFFKKKIYLYKMWKAETNILNFLEKQQKNKINRTKCLKILENLFPCKRKNLQKIAVTLTLINHVTFIVGGPGTGKTTTILKIIIALIKQSSKSIIIQLSAPTGKATTHLNEIIRNDIFDIYLSEKEKKSIPHHAMTIHDLLGMEKISQKSFIEKNNLLNIDVLIIDESSMIDILTMEKICLSISNSTKLIFIGDHNQLSPIECGFVLKNICCHAKYGYSNETISNIELLTKYKFFKKNNKKQNFISNKICVLKKVYRFKKNSNIYILSTAILQKNKKIIQKLFKNSMRNIFFHEINSIQQYEKMIEHIISNYNNFWKKIHNHEQLKKIIKKFQEYQVLCVMRKGFFGANILNKMLEEKMHEKNMIKYFYINEKKWYIGKPVMITKNDKNLDLFNGNIGITNINEEGICTVSFLKENNKTYSVPAKILKNYETAWAITVHKSQGSEFINTSLILPMFSSRILNQDILYTGITRSQKTLNIFSNKEIFINTIFKKKD